MRSPRELLICDFDEVDGVALEQKALLEVLSMAPPAEAAAELLAFVMLIDFSTNFLINLGLINITESCGAARLSAGLNTFVVVFRVVYGGSW